MPTVAELAWLAGYLDGEGSVGIARNKNTMIPVVQLSTTCPRAAERVQDIMEPIIGRVPSYTYEERDPAKHRDAIYLRATGMRRVKPLAEAMIPYAVTKLPNWQLILEFVNIRLERFGVDEKGNIKRGGNHLERGYGERETEIYRAIRSLNARGPQSETRQPPRLRSAVGAN